RHRNIADDNLHWLATLEQGHRLWTVARGDDRVAQALDERKRGFEHLLIVVAKQHPRTLSPPRLCGQLRRLWSSHGFAGARPTKRDGCPLADTAVDGQEAVHRLNEVLNGAETQSGAAAGVLGGEERLDSSVHHIWGHTDSGITNTHAHEITWPSVCRHG